MKNNFEDLINKILHQEKSTIFHFDNNMKRFLFGLTLLLFFFTKIENNYFKYLHLNKELYQV